MNLNYMQIFLKKKLQAFSWYLLFTNFLPKSCSNRESKTLFEVFVRIPSTSWDKMGIT